MFFHAIPPKVKMKVHFTDKEKVRRSPFYVGNRMWDKLNSKVQMSKYMLEFKNNLKKIDMTCI